MDVVLFATTGAFQVGARKQSRPTTDSSNSRRRRPRSQPFCTVPAAVPGRRARLNTARRWVGPSRARGPLTVRTWPRPSPLPDSERPDKAEAQSKAWFDSEPVGVPETAREPETKEVEPDARTCAWEERYAELLEFAKANGHVDVSRHDHEQARLYRWIVAQRHEWRRGRLHVAKYRRLSRLPGFVWDKHGATWHRRFYELVAFRDNYGHCSVSFSTSDPDCKSLARWVVKQRHLFKHGLLPDSRRRRLEGIGFRFTLHEDRFQSRLTELSAFKATHGHTDVPREWAKDPGLANWVITVRQKLRKGMLSAEQHRQLVDADFCFVPTEDEWQVNLQELKSFADTKGHTYPSFVDDPSLHIWLHTQRRLYNSNCLAQDRVEQLLGLGVELRPRRTVFRENIQELKKLHGKTALADVDLNSELGKWLLQVVHMGPQRLSRSEQTLLEPIGISWPVRTPLRSLL